MITKTPTSPTEVLASVYGKKLPVQCLGRLKTEQSLIRKNFFRDQTLATALRYAADEDGSDVDVEGNYGASLLNWLYGATNVNPLLPHYRCKECKRTLFYTEGDGWDLPPMECCGKPMVRDGHRIPIEVMLQRLDYIDWELDFRIAGSFAEKAVDIIRKYYKREFTVVPYVTDDSETEDRRFALIPKSSEMPGLDENGIWHTDWDELYQLKYRVIRLHCVEIKEQLRNYRIKTGLTPTIEDVLSLPVLAATQAKLTIKIVEEGGRPLKVNSPSFSSLLRTIGYLESEHTEDNPMLSDPEARYTDVFTCREDVWELLCGAMKPEYEISMELTKKIMKRVRAGMYTRNRMEPDTEQLLRDLGISDHWIEQMKQTGFLRGRSDLIDHLLDELALTWYELQTEKGSEQGRFVLCNGKLRPSDSYLASHELPNYDPDDWKNDAYSVWEDEGALLEKRICEKCGAEFTIPEAVERYRQSFEWPPYLYEHVGELCGDCAAKDTESKFDKSE